MVTNPGTNRGRRCLTLMMWRTPLPSSTTNEHVLVKSSTLAS